MASPWPWKRVSTSQRPPFCDYRRRISVCKLWGSRTSAPGCLGGDSGVRVPGAGFYQLQCVVQERIRSRKCSLAQGFPAVIVPCLGDADADTRQTRHPPSASHPRHPAERFTLPCVSRPRIDLSRASADFLPQAVDGRDTRRTRRTRGRPLSLRLEPGCTYRAPVCTGRVGGGPSPSSGRSNASAGPGGGPCAPWE